MTILRPNAGSTPESGHQAEVKRQIHEDRNYMSNDFANLVQGIQKRQGVNLTPERMEGIERQRTILLSRIENLQKQHFHNYNEFLNVRNRIVDQVHQLRHYAEFQAQQQREMERAGSRQPLDLQREEAQGHERIWIPIRPQSRLEFAYVRNTPNAGRLVGTIEVSPNTVSSTMAGTYRMDRVTHQGQQYLAFTMDRSFEGTFTFTVDGRAATVDIAAHGESRQRREKMRAVPPVLTPPTLQPAPEPAPPEVSVPTGQPVQRVITEAMEMEKRLRSLLADYEALEKRATEGIPRGELRKQLQELEGRIKEMQTAQARISEGLAILNQITDLRIRDIYAHLLMQPRGQWYPSGGVTVPGGSAGAQYRLSIDGKLYAQRFDGSDRTRPTTYRMFNIARNAWDDLPLPGGGQPV